MLPLDRTSEYVERANLQNLVDFVNGSVLTESELDRAYLHNRYLAEEIGELNDASLQRVPGSDNWDAQGKRITNVGTPVNSQDATTKNYVDGTVSSIALGVGLFLTSISSQEQVQTTSF